MRPTYVKIDMSRLRENLRKIRADLPEGVTATAVVKANAYGHGSVEVSRVAVEEGYDALAVALPEEALTLRKAGIDVPIYILGLTLPPSFDEVVESRCIPAVEDSTDLAGLEACAEKSGRRVECCIAVDTGMHRIGIVPEDALDMMDRIEAFPHLRVNGFFSHMANADAADQSHAKGQIEGFAQMAKRVKAQRGAHYRFSIANSAGLLAIPESIFTDVRPGIIMYGLMPSECVPNRLDLEPVLSFHSHVVHVQHLRRGESVGYGSAFTAESPCTVATLPVGYADGYPRCLSNRSSVLIAGKRCPVVGHICMDQLMVRLPDGLSAVPGDEAVLIGRQGGECIAAEELARLAGTIAYEIVSDVAARVPRQYV
ncbi:MAG: alanine racemase [Pyramidobacter sp.]|jgi:alanine racemase